MKRLVSAHKEDQVLALTPFFGERLTVALRALLVQTESPKPAALVLVPVPSARAAVRERGFDATSAIARAAASAHTGRRRPTVRQLLRQSRRVQDQAGLSATARQQNLAGSYRVAGPGLDAGCWAVIIDDVVTTGASLTEAARALRAAQIPVLGAATVAATVRSRANTTGSSPV